MTSNAYVIDTHALLWFLEKNRRLSSHVRGLIVESQTTDSIILVPTIVLAEALAIIEKKRSHVTLAELLAAMRETNRFEVVPLDLPDVRTNDEIAGDARIARSRDRGNGPALRLSVTEPGCRAQGNGNDDLVAGRQADMRNMGEEQRP